MCIIGYEETPINPDDAYNLNTETETWIIIADVSANIFPVFHTKKWSLIVQDLFLLFPEYINIRNSGAGI